MRCYLVTAGDTKRYAGTSADARETREELMALTAMKKKDVTIEQTEIPTPKNELLQFVNELLGAKEA